MATLDEFFKKRDESVPLMVDESILPQGTITYSPQDASKGMPVKARTLILKGKLKLKLRGLGWTLLLKK